MHRHGYKGRKFGRQRDQRKALLKGLVSSLIIHGKIETTLPKAKELVPKIEKLITQAKQNNLSARRRVIASVSTLPVAYRLVDEIAPKLTKRTSGHVRLSKTGLRRGDNAQLAQVSFVDKVTPASSSVAQLRPAKPKAQPKNEDQSEIADPAVKTNTKIISQAPSIAAKQTLAPKRTGRRGDR